MHIVQAAAGLLGRQPGLQPLPLLPPGALNPCNMWHDCVAASPSPPLGKVVSTSLQRRAHLKGIGFWLDSLKVRKMGYVDS